MWPRVPAACERLHLHFLFEEHGFLELLASGCWHGVVLSGSVGFGAYAAPAAAAATTRPMFLRAVKSAWSCGRRGSATMWCSEPSAANHRSQAACGMDLPRTRSAVLRHRYLPEHSWCPSWPRTRAAD